MEPLLKSIRETPLSYLPYTSLIALTHFRDGYSARCEMEGQPHNWGYDRLEFHEWLCHRFQSEGAAAIGDASIVSSYSVDEVDAFHNYFAFLEEFLSLKSAAKQPPNGRVQRKDLIGTIKAIRERPAIYLGHATFRGCYSYLMGDERGYYDLRLPAEDGRLLFRDFMKWIETTKNQAGLSRRWFKIIEFWSGGIDCGHTPGGAFALFFSWLDEHVKLIGKKGLFGVTQEIW
jgi:hypothetical protein